MKEKLEIVVSGPHHAHRIDNLFATRELVGQALEERGIDPEHAWPQILETLSAELSAWAIARALRVCCPEPIQLTALKSNNTSGARGVDFNRGRWRARCWKGGKVVWQLSSIDRQRVIDARAKFLAGQQ